MCVYDCVHTYMCIYISVLIYYNCPKFEGLDSNISELKCVSPFQRSGVSFQLGIPDTCCSSAYQS